MIVTPCPNNEDKQHHFTAILVSSHEDRSSVDFTIVASKFLIYCENCGETRQLRRSKAAEGK